MRYIKVVRHPMFWVTCAGLIWGWFGMPLHVTGWRWTWSYPYSYHTLSTLLGGAAGFFMAVLGCKLWAPEKLGIRRGAPLMLAGWSSLALCIICVFAQFHLSEAQYRRQSMLWYTISAGLEPVHGAWIQMVQRQQSFRSQDIAVSLLQGSAILKSINLQLRNNSVRNALPLSRYLERIGTDMLNHNMPTAETSEFDQFLSTSGPYLDKHVANGFTLTPRNLQLVFQAMYSALPSEYRINTSS